MEHEHATLHSSSGSRLRNCPHAFVCKCIYAPVCIYLSAATSELVVLDTDTIRVYIFRCVAWNPNTLLPIVAAAVGSEIVLLDASTGFSGEAGAAIQELLARGREALAAKSECVSVLCTFARVHVRLRTRARACVRVHVRVGVCGLVARSRKALAAKSVFMSHVCVLMRVHLCVCT